MLHSFRYFPTVLTTLALSLIAASGFAQNKATPSRQASPVVLELFTSQGCSSCPPADRLLSKLALEPNTIVLSRPVTYWDRLGWKDTLARPENTKLQYDYAARDATESVFTPQIVIDGVRQTIGSREGEVRQLISTQREKAGKLTLTPRQEANGEISVSVNGPVKTAGTITLVRLRGRVPVQIGRGENGGVKVDYTNVVVSEQVLGEWRGTPLMLNIDPAKLRGGNVDRLAVIVQARTSSGLPGAMLGATIFSL
jgi:hypothetical protein